MPTAIRIGLGLLALAYILFNEYRLWDLSHIRWDAEVAICKVVPDHC